MIVLSGTIYKSDCDFGGGKDEMAMLTQAEKGTAFRGLHERDDAFIIPNPWDNAGRRGFWHIWDLKRWQLPVPAMRFRLGKGIIRFSARR